MTVSRAMRPVHSVAGGGGANEDQEMRMLETGEINCEAVLGRQAGLNWERA